MALRWCDSFDHYLTADLQNAEKWDAIDGSPEIGATAGRRSTQGLRCPYNTSGAATVSKTLDSQATWIVGVAFKASTLTTSSRSLIRLLDGGTLQVELVMDSGGTLSVRRGDGTVLGTSAYALATGGFYYLEFKATLHDTTGSAVVRVDGVERVNLANQDTQQSANASADTVSLGPAVSGNAVTWDWDDLVVCDASGSTNNDFLGDCRVDCGFPDAEGDYTEWTGGAGQWALVDDLTPDDESSYITSNIVGQRSAFDFPAFPTLAGAGVKGVAVTLSAKKDSADVRSLKGLVRSGTTDSDLAAQALTTSYAFYQFIQEVDPATGLAWGESALNEAQFGVEVA